MSEPLEMTFDFGPYARLLKRKPDPKKMSDDELAKQLAQVRRLPDNARPYAGTVAMMLFMTCPAIGAAAMLLGAASPLLWLIGSAIVLWQGAKRLLPAASSRAHADMASFEDEIKNRALTRAYKAEQDKIQAEAQKVKTAADMARRAKEAFDSALDNGLPLEKKIAVPKSLKLKPVAQAVKDAVAEMSAPKAPGPVAASSAPAGGPPLSRGPSQG